MSRLDLTGLNSPQAQAVLHTHGPLLVLAGAGSGKTRVVTMRIARLLLQGQAARSILAVTFTNKAAKEMKERLMGLVGKAAARGVQVSTFHALCARLLRRDAHRIGLKNGFAILDEGDQIAQIVRVAKSNGLQLSEKEPKQVLSKIGYWKNQGLRRTEQPDALGAVAGDPVTLVAARLWQPYADHLRALAALDFDDLLLLARELLETVPDVRARYQALIRFIHIDEYQDTNPLQLEIVRLLCGPDKNLCVVGDDDQAIYGFRGGSVENILAFDTQFSPCTTVTLEQNYRSTGFILAAANAVIEKNPLRKQKTLFSALGDGDALEVVARPDGDDEADYVAQRCFDLVFKDQLPAEEIALLYRAAPQSRAYEETLRAKGVPYRVVGGQEFYARKEVKDALAYLTLLCRPGDEMAFRRALQVPSRGTGDKAVQKIIAAAKESGRSLVDEVAAGAPGADLKDKQRVALMAFGGPLLETRAKLLALTHDPEADLPAVCRDAVNRAGLAQAAKDEDDLESRRRREDSLEEVLDAFAAFLDRVRDAFEAPDLLESRVLKDEVDAAVLEAEGPLAAYLDRVALDDDERDRDSEKKEEKRKKGKVQLMTLHASKGLEFPVVFLVGFEEGLMPHRRVLEEAGEAGVVEERRLAYVGITRARRRLVISWAKTRKKRGELLPRKPSRFIADIPPAVKEETGNDEGKIAAAADPAAAFFSLMKSRLGDAP